MRSGTGRLAGLIAGFRADDGAECSSGGSCCREGTPAIVVVSFGGVFRIFNPPNSTTTPRAAPRCDLRGH